MPTESGIGQLIARCPRCYTAVWSHYAGSGPLTKFIRGGTLDKKAIDGRSVEAILKPDIFIFTCQKMSWITYPDSAHAEDNVAEEFYDLNEKWPKQCLDRYTAIRPEAREWQQRGFKWEEVGEFVDCR
jgi:hypothetical protein